MGDTFVEEVVNEEEINFDASKMALSSYGNLELNDVLYKNGLQNIFNDYQQNIQKLSQQEQQNLQDAYYVREMSEKYLGEYASNTGIGDVSGNLLDIYSNYQKNLSEIQGNYDALEMNLQNEYNMAKMQKFEDIMINQYNIEVAKLDELAQEISFNALTGKYDTNAFASPFEYLESMKSRINPTQYQSIYGALKTEVYSEVETNLTNGYFGEFDNASDYINSFGTVFNPSELSVLNGIAQSIEQDELYKEATINLTKGNYGDFGSAVEYVDSLEDGLDAKEYLELRDKAYEVTTRNIELNIDEGNYGEFASMEEYINSYEDILRPEDMELVRLYYDNKQKEDAYDEVYNNIMQNEFDGHDNSLAYLDANKNRMDLEKYNELRNEIYPRFVQSVWGKLDTLDVEELQEYLDDQKADLSDTDYKLLQEYVDEKIAYDNYASKISDVISYSDYYLEDGITINENYQPNYDPTYYFNLEGISSTSKVYSHMGMEYVQMDASVDEEGNVFSEDITDYFMDPETGPGFQPSIGKMIDYKGNLYVFDKDAETGMATWFRLASGGVGNQLREMQENGDIKLSLEKRNESISMNGITYEGNGAKMDTLEYNGIKYIEVKDDQFKPSDAQNDTWQSELVQTFKDTYGELKELSVVFFQGRFWVYSSAGKIRPFAVDKD